MRMLKIWLSFLVFLSIVAPGTAQLQTHPPRVLLPQLEKTTTDTARMRLFVQLADYYLFEAELAGKDDSAEVWLRQAATLNQRYHLPAFQDHIDILSACIREDRTPDHQEKAVFLPLIDECKTHKDKENERIAWFLLGDATESISKNDSTKIGYYQRSADLSVEAGNIAGEVRARTEIAYSHEREGKQELATTELQQLLKDPRVAPLNDQRLYDILAKSYIARSKFDSALFYALKAETLMEQSGDSVNMIQNYNNLLIIYSNLGKLEQSIFWTRKTLDHCIWTKQTDFIYPVGTTIVNQYLKLDKAREGLVFLADLGRKYPPASLDDRRQVQKDYGSIYRNLKEYDLAEKSFLEMIRIGDQEKFGYSADEKASALHTLGDFYVETGRFAKAKPYLDSALRAFEKLGLLAHIRNLHRALYRTDSALGNYIPAMQHLQEVMRLGDTIFNKERNKQIEQLSIAYETDKKEKDLKILRDKEQLEKSQLHQAQISRDWIIVATALLLVIAGLLYRQSRLRKRNNQTITQKNELLESLVVEKEWLLKEVHHRVKNNLHTVLCLLESQSAYLENDAFAAIENSKRRIYAMSLIHQKLYRTDDLETIDMAQYLREFVQYLEESFGSPGNIHVRLDIPPVKLGVAQAIPLGLITNEAVTNAFKYAFPNGRRGEITIRLLSSGQGLHYVIADNGIGIHDLPPDSDSLGIELMRGLARDLHGRISFINGSGTTVNGQGTTVNLHFSTEPQFVAS